MIRDFIKHRLGRREAWDKPAGRVSLLKSDPYRTAVLACLFGLETWSNESFCGGEALSGLKVIQHLLLVCAWLLGRFQRGGDIGEFRHKLSTRSALFAKKQSAVPGYKFADDWNANNE